MDYYCQECKRIILLPNADPKVNYTCLECGYRIKPRFEGMPALEEQDAKNAMEEVEAIFKDFGKV